MTFRTQSIVAYGLVYGPIQVLASYPLTVARSDGSIDAGAVWLYAFMAAAGVALLLLKNRRLADREARRRLIASDLAVAAASLALAVAPADLSPIRQLAIAVLFLGYAVWRVTSAERLDLA